MNLLSKFYNLSFNLIGSYLSELYTNPIRTKSLTSCFISLLGNYISQRNTSSRLINYDALWAFGIFGLLFGGSLPHIFYEKVTAFLKEHSSTPLIQLFIIERLFFMPSYMFFGLCVLSWLEGKAYNEAFDEASVQWLPIVKDNLKYLSLFQFINVFFVPPILKVFVSNMIGFFWVIYVSYKRQQSQSQNAS